jgi:nicotinamidase/pyrazinamidase
MRTVFVDVDTQIDFMFPSGALYVPGAEKIVDKVAALNRYAVEHGIALISTMDEHSENDPEFEMYPHHCVVGTLGQRKPAATIVGQHFVTKQKLDCFTAPKMHELIGQFGAERYVVYGVVSEICVKLAAAGLLKTGARVEIVTDAVKSLSDETASAWHAEFRSSGGILAESHTISK